MLDEARACSAVELFIERAAAADQRFALGADNVGAVGEICRHLDGIPLAIELAAARAAAIPPAEIAARLGERFRLLAGGSRRTQERHRTLLSLVQYDPAEGRYRLLETLRQYGADRLLDAGETDLARARHARHFLDLAERVAPELSDARCPRALALLAAELENLRALAEWCGDRGGWTELATLVRHVWLFIQQMAPVDGATWCALLGAHEGDLDREDVVDILGKLAYLTTLVLGDHGKGLELADRSVSTAVRQGSLNHRGRGTRRARPRSTPRHCARPTGRSASSAVSPPPKPATTNTPPR